MLTEDLTSMGQPNMLDKQKDLSGKTKGGDWGKVNQRGITQASVCHRRQENEPAVKKREETKVLNGNGRREQTDRVGVKDVNGERSKKFTAHLGQLLKAKKIPPAVGKRLWAICSRGDRLNQAVDLVPNEHRLSVETILLYMAQDPERFARPA